MPSISEASQDRGKFWEALGSFAACPLASLRRDLRQHRQDVLAELRWVLAHREVADFLHDLNLDARDLPGRAQRVLGRAGEVGFAGQQAERAGLGVGAL